MTRRERLAALAREHDDWITEHLAEVEAAFNASSRPDGSDYNLHHADVDADGATQDDFYQRTARIFPEMS